MIDTELLIAIKDTFIMVLIPTICAVFLGVPLGAVVFLTDKVGIRENKFINILCNIYINAVRSFLFLIFVVFQIVWHFLLVDARSNLVLGLTSAIISFISYSIVMGVVGGGGIGDYAMRYGYNEYNYALVYRAVAIRCLIYWKKYKW